MSDEVDPWNIDEKSERELNERLQELKEKPYLDQRDSSEFDLIEDELYERASEERREAPELR